MKACCHMYPRIYRGQERRIAKKYDRQYESLKGAIYQHLSKRHEFQRAIDAVLIEQASRLFADGLYVEELLSGEEGKASVWKYTDALAKIHSMLIATLDELQISPKTRSKITQEILHDDEITAKLKILMGAQ
jgi:hypothetical protein